MRPLYRVSTHIRPIDGYKLLRRWIHYLVHGHECALKTLHLIFRSLEFEIRTNTQCHRGGGAGGGQREKERERGQVSRRLSGAAFRNRTKAPFGDPNRSRNESRGLPLGAPQVLINCLGSSYWLLKYQRGATLSSRGSRQAGSIMTEF